MSLSQSLAFYLTLNVLVILAYLALKSLFGTVKGFTFHNRLKWNYTFILIILSLAIIHPFLLSKTLFEPPAKVWSARSHDNSPTELLKLENPGYLKLSLIDSDRMINGNSLFKISLMVFIPLLFIIAVLLGHDLYKLRKIKNASFHFYRFRNLEIKIHDGIKVPFSFILGRKAYVVIPSAILSERDYFKAAIFHEIQHHRQGDTKWIYLIWFLKFVCFFNPAIQ